MELQNFISNTPEYVKELKKNKVNVRTYSKLGLAIVKCYRNQDYDYEKQPWIRYCRGAVINLKTNQLMCVPPLKASITENLSEIISNYDNESEYQPLVEGTMIKMFYHNNEWMISTRSNIGAKNSLDGKVPFYQMFLEVLGYEWFSELNKENCYSFVLCHKNNRIVTPVQENAIYLIEVYKMGNTIEKQELQTIPGIYNMINLSHDQLHSYDDNLYFSIKGFTIKNKDSRINWINPNYIHVRDLKMNYNDKFLNYIGLRQSRLLTEYLQYFPEDQYEFNKYREEFNIIKQRLHESYLSHFVRKQKSVKEIEYPLRPLIFKLHEFYKKTNEVITIKVVSDYLHNLPGKKMLFIKNYLFKNN